MTVRPRCVSVYALSFVLLSVVAACCAVTNFYLLWIHHRIFLLERGVLIAGFAIMYAATARGLWRLTPGFRIVALWLSAIDTLILLCANAIDPEFKAQFQTPDLAMWIGFIIGWGLALLFFAGPLYFLTRPAVIRAFSQGT